MSYHKDEQINRMEDVEIISWKMIQSIHALLTLIRHSATDNEMWEYLGPMILDSHKLKGAVEELIKASPPRPGEGR